MPHRDGTPTNNERIFETQGVALEAYTTDFLMVFEGDVPASYSNKPVNQLHFRAVMEPHSPTGSGVVREVFTAHPLREEDVEAMVDNPFLERRYPSADIERYLALAADIAEVTVNNALDIRRTLTEPGAIIFDYTAEMANGRTRHVGSLKEKPTTLSSASGLAMARMVLSHVKDTHKIDNTTPSAERPDYATHSLKHHLYYPVSDRVPINGHEPLGYLVTYLQEMECRAEQTRQSITRMSQLSGGAVIVEGLTKQLERYIAAAETARQYIPDNTSDL